MRCIGIGNFYRRDDGVGLYVAQRLRLENLPNLCVIEHGGEGTSLLGAMGGVSEVILVDAVRSCAQPGTIVQFCANARALPPASFGRSSHAFGVAEAIELARALGQLPESCVVYGIEGECFGWGMGLSPAVERAARSLVSTITGRLRAEQASLIAARLK